MAETELLPATIDVSPSLARALIERQFRELAPARVEWLGSGSDNIAYCVNGACVFRFPRRQKGVPMIQAELGVLPVIASLLPVPIPNPCWAGQPGEDYPYPFAGYHLLPGRTADTVGLDEAQRQRAAEPLGRFLAALHAIPTERVAASGAAPHRDEHPAPDQLVAPLRAFLTELEQSGLIDDARPLLTLLEASVVPFRPRADALVHGDLTAFHLLVDGDARLCGIIDWGSLCLDDPAYDIAIAHIFLPPSAHDAFRHAYGPMAEETWCLSRLHALYLTAMGMAFGRRFGDAAMEREGRSALSLLVKGAHR